jgi:hypothetical protein
MAFGLDGDSLMLPTCYEVGPEVAVPGRSLHPKSELGEQKSQVALEVFATHGVEIVQAGPGDQVPSAQTHCDLRGDQQGE